MVSSTLLSKIAAAAGARYAETLTGFKWIVRAGDGVPGARFVFGYEEALGYAVSGAVRDKDGISAALALLSLAATARAAGQTLLDRWDALETDSRRPPDRAGHPAHAVPGPGHGPAAGRSPGQLAGLPVTGTTDLAGGTGGLPPSDVLTYHLPGARVVIRPSGTEPKLKAYLEVVEPVGGRSLATARAAATARMTPLRHAVASLVSART